MSNVKPKTLSCLELDDSRNQLSSKFLNSQMLSFTAPAPSSYALHIA